MSKNANKRAVERPGNTNRAFTLVELLAVTAVIAVMMVAVVPAFNGISGAGNVTKAAYDLAGTLDQARAYAMANNTYVFVGLVERDGVDSSKSGQGQVLMAAMGSKNGTRSFGANNANLVPLSRMRRLENVHLQESVPNTGAMSRPAVQQACRLANDAFVAQDSFLASGQQFTKIIQFDPRGMASIQSASSSVPQWMEIGLVGARGNVVAETQNCAAVVLDGVTGATKIYRP